MKICYCKSTQINEDKLRNNTHTYSHYLDTKSNPCRTIHELISMDDVHVNFRNLVLQHCIQQGNMIVRSMLQVAYVVHLSSQWLIGMQVSIVQSWSTYASFHLFRSLLFNLIYIRCISAARSPNDCIGMIYIQAQNISI